jgi:hypothetical protein
MVFNLIVFLDAFLHLHLVLIFEFNHLLTRLAGNEIGFAALILL